MAAIRNDNGANEQNALITAWAFVSNFKQFSEIADNEMINAYTNLFLNV